MQASRQARLFRNGSNQALRIPREFELPGSEVLIHKDGERLILEPMARPRLLDVLAALSPVGDAFPGVDADMPPLDEVRL